MLFKSASDGETIGGETMSLRRKKTVACPKCNKESDYLFWESLNGDLDPEAKTQLIDGTLNVPIVDTNAKWITACFTMIWRIKL